MDEEEAKQYGENMYQWNETFDWGVEQEIKVLDYLSALKPELEIKPMGGLDNPDGMCKLGGIEIKSYSTWYYHPSIETKCILPYSKDSCWLSDDRTSIVVCNHEGNLHLFKAEELRYHYKQGTFPTYKKWVSQGDGTKKLMEFISIRSLSTLTETIKNPTSKDRLRWDCSKIETRNPYLVSVAIQ
jgi:hypothetical protein